MALLGMLILGRIDTVLTPIVGPMITPVFAASRLYSAAAVSNCYTILVSVH